MREPFVSDTDFTLYVGDVREVLAGLQDESVHCVVTSPPYWGLRDYGTGSWEGGDPECDHLPPMGDAAGLGSSTLEGGKKTTAHQQTGFGATCGKCGATRTDRQLGLEPTPEEYVAAMVGVFREVRRVLRRDGTCWLNLGDSYGSGTMGRNDAESLGDYDRRVGHAVGAVDARVERRAQNRGQSRSRTRGLKQKDLVGIPWRVAFALQTDGWYLRSDIIWSKPNPMPESVTDRPTKAHEYLFLLTRSPRYFYDADAIREPAEWARWGDQTVPKHEGTPTAAGWIKPKSKQDLLGEQRKKMRGGDTASGFNGRWAEGNNPTGRNKRSVWEIATEPYPDAHFATFPTALVEPCVKAGCPLGGVVLDPFAGSGTTALVARKLGRRSIGIELNEEYARLAAKRLSQLSLLSESAA